MLWVTEMEGETEVVVVDAGNVVAEDEEFIQAPVADIHEVMAILEKM